MKIPFGTVSVTAKSKEIISEILESNRLSSGKYVREFEKKFAEFETEAWLVIGAMLTAVFTANDYKTEICFDKEGIAREAVAARADGRCYE